MTDERPRYSLFEIERRWLVDRDLVGDLENAPFRRIDDLYVEGTRLRLRKVLSPDGETEYKLGKKYGNRSRFSEPITTLYLTELEYLRLSALPGSLISKRRYSVEGGSLDLFDPPNDEVTIFELEFESDQEAAAYAPPPFVEREVTGDPSFTCFALATRDHPITRL